MDLNIIIVDDMSLPAQSAATDNVTKQAGIDSSIYALSDSDKQIISRNTAILDAYFSKITDDAKLKNESDRIISAIKARQDKYESNSRQYAVFQSYIDYISNITNISLSDILGEKTDLEQ